MIHLSHSTNPTVKTNNKDRYVGNLYDIVILESKDDIQLLCGIGVTLFICNFERDIQFEEEILNAYIFDGTERIGDIKYLNQNKS